MITKNHFAAVVAFPTPCRDRLIAWQLGPPSPVRWPVRHRVTAMSAASPMLPTAFPVVFAETARDAGRLLAAVVAAGPIVVGSVVGIAFFVTDR